MAQSTPKEDNKAKDETEKENAPPQGETTSGSAPKSGRHCLSPLMTVVIHKK